MNDLWAGQAFGSV